MARAKVDDEGKRSGAAGAGELGLCAYYADGNRRYKWANGDHTQSSFDGDQEIYEVNSAGQKLRRYVRLPGAARHRRAFHNLTAFAVGSTCLCRSEAASASRRQASPS